MICSDRGAESTRDKGFFAEWCIPLSAGGPAAPRRPWLRRAEASLSAS